MSDPIQSIKNRRSIRSYTDQPVEQEKLVLLLEAAMAAPNACNSLPWEFVVITEPETLAKLRTHLLFARYNAPAAIVVCGNPGIANSPAAKHFWVQDCSAATENILLAAGMLGLGAVWIGVYPLPSVIRPVSQIVNLPETVIPLCVVYVGYPAEQKAHRTQYDEHRVHWQIYQPRKKRARVKNSKHLE